jgi:hypothetical protein
MAYSNQCPYCGANLDPGEKCDCKKAKAARTGRTVKSGKRNKSKKRISKAV